MVCEEPSAVHFCTAGTQCWNNSCLKPPQTDQNQQFYWCVIMAESEVYKFPEIRFITIIFIYRDNFSLSQYVLFCFSKLVHTSGLDSRTTTDGFKILIIF